MTRVSMRDEGLAGGAAEVDWAARLGMAGSVTREVGCGKVCSGDVRGFGRPAGARILSRTHSRGNPFPPLPAALSAPCAAAIAMPIESAATGHRHNETPYHLS